MQTLSIAQKYREEKRQRAESVLNRSIVAHRPNNRRICFCYYADEVESWYWLNPKDLEYAIELSRRVSGEELYNEWCDASGKKVHPFRNVILNQLYRQTASNQVATTL